jgi:hypothetical protein
MVIGRHSDGMRFGVFNGSSVNWKNGVTSTTGNLYLIENPTEKEQGIKQKIIERLEKSRQESEEYNIKRKALQRIPTKDLVIGESYVNDTGNKYVYLGKGSVYDSYDEKTQVGYIYLSCYSDRYNKDADTFDYLPYVNVLKNPKKLVSTVDSIMGYSFDKSEFTLKETATGNDYWGSRKRKTLVFKLGEVHE